MNENTSKNLPEEELGEVAGGAQGFYVTFVCPYCGETDRFQNTEFASKKLEHLRKCSKAPEQFKKGN